METFLSILDIVKWPLLALIVIAIFYRPLARLINRIKGFKGANYAFDVEPGTNQQMTDKLIKAEESKIGAIEKALNLFSDETRKMFQAGIVSETEIDKITEDKAKIRAFTNYSEALYALLHFERIYYQIFGSQIRMLSLLNSSFDQTVESVKFFYDNAVQHNPELRNYPYVDYLEFLRSRQLVQISDHKIQVTWFGRDFLKFMTQMGYTDLKAN